MSKVSIVPDDILLRFVAAQHVISAPAEVLDDAERAFGWFNPEAELLRAAIDAVFWASLSEEEGKPALVRVRFADIRDPFCRLEPTPITTDALCKLSPLLDVSSNALLIRRDATIVGVGVWHSLDIGIVAHRPGRLTVLDRSHVLGVFDKGKWVIVGGNSQSVIGILEKALPGNDFPVRFFKASLILDIVTKARRAGRGATLVIVPGDSRRGIGSISYPVEEFPALPNALEKWRQKRDVPPKYATTEAAIMRLEWLKEMQQAEIDGLIRSATAIVASGAGIDGATLIDDSNLRLLGFGAKINALDEEFDLQLLELPDSTFKVIEKSDTGGMRHQTAARLVKQNNDATVIVVSQDGPVSLFTWVHNTANVVMVKHLDRYLEGEARRD